MSYHHPPRFDRKKQHATEHQWEMRELKRLMWAILLFLTVFLGKQIYPERVLSVGEEVIGILGASTDLEAVFADLGESIHRPDDMLHTLEEFCVEVFGARDEVAEQGSAMLSPTLPASGVGLMKSDSSHTLLYAKLLPETTYTDKLPSEHATLDHIAVPAVGTVLEVGKPPKQKMPEGYTVDKLSLGELQTVAPVTGQLTSGFGYRDHPVNGKYLFHGGVDIGADRGDDVLSFADGRVEYIGEDRSYGLYFQIDHGNGVKSFYAHCQRICVQKGQNVKAGETVAKVGSTGTTTGPHLHLELKCGDMRVDPAYYIEVLSPA